MPQRIFHYTDNSPTNFHFADINHIDHIQSESVGFSWEDVRLLFLIVDNRALHSKTPQINS